MIADEDAKKIADAVFDKFLRYLVVAGSAHVLYEAINRILEPPLTYFVHIGTASAGAWLYYLYLRHRPKSAAPPQSSLPTVTNYRSSAYNRATGRYEEV